MTPAAARPLHVLQVIEAGANAIVSGSGVFGAKVRQRAWEWRAGVSSFASQFALQRAAYVCSRLVPECCRIPMLLRTVLHTLLLPCRARQPQYPPALRPCNLPSACQHPLTSFSEPQDYAAAIKGIKESKRPAAVHA